MARTIQSPGVEIKEVDLSLRPQLPVGTTVFIPGFANQGPTDELLTVSSLSEFEQIYGLPSNAAERYMYHTVKAVFQSPANILVSRLPYGTGAGTTVADKYSVQVFPVIPRPIMVDAANPDINSVEKDQRLIAWYPTDSRTVDDGGDYVLAQAASADNAPTTMTIVATDTGAAQNDWTIVVQPGEVTNSIEFVDGVITAKFTEPSVDGAELVAALGSIEEVIATGGQSTQPAEPATATVSFTLNDDVSTSDPVTLTAQTVGLLPTGIVLTGNGSDTVLQIAEAAGVTASGPGANQVPSSQWSYTLNGGSNEIVAGDAFGQETTITFAGGLDQQLSTKVVPYGEWIFGETSPGEDYSVTTLKDAVDSVLAANVTLSGYSQNNLFWVEENEGDPLSVPALKAYEIPEVADLVAGAVNAVGWDLGSSDRYYLAEPSNIELDNDTFQKVIKGKVKLKETEAGKYSNQKFSEFNDLLTKGGAGLMIVNDKKFVVNEKFEGYYIGISDNTNLNPASDFDSVGKLKSLSKKLGGTTGGYVDVPDENDGTKSRLTFSLSAGAAFDEYGNKMQIGLDGSMSETLENLSEYDLNTDEFSDVLTIAVFKVRQSTLEPDATKLDYIVADSVIGSTNYFRERFL